MYGLYVFPLQVIGPFAENEDFNSADWSMLEGLESDNYASGLVTLVEELQVIGLSVDDDTSLFRSDLVMKIASLLRSAPRRRRLSELPKLSSEHRQVGCSHNSMYHTVCRWY